jgi:N-acetylmuramoyl-L-alanine amidase
MAQCPFAAWLPLPGSAGEYVDDHPFKIVHHTTEGSTADVAIATYKQTRNIPHFTVDDMTIYQHADTDVAVSALKHPAGGTETNRSSAIQIELVGFAADQKTRTA